MKHFVLLAFSVSAIAVAQTIANEVDLKTRIKLKKISAPQLSIGLQKNLLGPTATSYHSTYFNFDYKCPLGWTITSFDSTPNYFFLEVSKALYSKITILGSIFATASEANYHDAQTCFSTVVLCFDASKDKIPGIYSCFDTTFNSTGIHMTGVNVKFKMDANFIFQSQCINCSESNRKYQHEYYYFTTPADYSANSAEYIKHWLNSSFITTTTGSSLTKNPSLTLRSYDINVKSNAISLSAIEQQTIKIELHNLLGKIVANLYDGVINGSVAIPLDPNLAKNQYVLKIKSKNDQTILPLRNIK